MLRGQGSTVYLSVSPSLSLPCDMPSYRYIHIRTHDYVPARGNVHAYTKLYYNPSIDAPVHPSIYPSIHPSIHPCATYGTHVAHMHDILNYIRTYLQSVYTCCLHASMHICMHGDMHVCYATWVVLCWYGMVWYGMVWYGMYVCAYVRLYARLFVGICTCSSVRTSTYIHAFRQIPTLDLYICIGVDVHVGSHG